MTVQINTRVIYIQHAGEKHFGWKFKKFVIFLRRDEKETLEKGEKSCSDLFFSGYFDDFPSASSFPPTACHADLDRFKPWMTA